MVFASGGCRLHGEYQRAAEGAGLNAQGTGTFKIAAPVWDVHLVGKIAKAGSFRRSQGLTCTFEGVGRLGLEPRTGGL